MASFRMFAGTDVGLRDNNEDNFTVCPDLSRGEWMVPSNQQETIMLGPKGCIMVVADGMGGMNAGEVASAIAISTVEQMFSPRVMPPHTVESPEAIQAYLRKVIVCADVNVKKRCKEDPSTEGMGSTIVVAWLVGGEVYVGWMGDSRAYSYIPGRGVSRLSKDHSYVQELVDANLLTEEEAMVHPQSNVIVRSLGDAATKAKPDIVCHSVVKGEIILLCSDGLCGVLTDADIAEITGRESADLKTCKEALTSAAIEADGSDNITIALLQIVDAEHTEHAQRNNSGRQMPVAMRKRLWPKVLFFTLAVALCVVLMLSGAWCCQDEKPLGDSPGQRDSAQVEQGEVSLADSARADSTGVVGAPALKTPVGTERASERGTHDADLPAEEGDPGAPTRSEASGASVVTPSGQNIINNNNKQEQ